MNASSVVLIVAGCIYVAWLALLVFGPMILLLKRIADVDSGKKKLLGLYAGLFFSGLLCAPLALVVERGAEALLISSNASPGWTSFATAFGVAAIPEESLKFAFLLIFVFWSGRLTKYVRGVAFAAFVSLGFAAIENVCYVLSSGTSNGAEGAFITAFLRAFTSLPGHFVFSVYMGYFLSLAFLGPKKGENLFKKRVRFSDWDAERKRCFAKNLAFSWLVAVGAHGLYDFFLMFGATGGPLSGISVVSFLAFFVASYWFGSSLVDRLKEKDAVVRAKKDANKTDGVYRILTRRNRDFS